MSLYETRIVKSYDRFLVVDIERDRFVYGLGLLCLVLGCSVDELLGSGRERRFVDCRSIVVRYYRDCGYSVVELATMMRRTHADILHHLKRYDGLYGVDRKFSRECDVFLGVLGILDREWEVCEDGLRHFTLSTELLIETVKPNNQIKEEKIMITNDLNNEIVSVSEYASMKGVSTTAVYKWIAGGQVDVIMISGIKFVVLRGDDVELAKEWRERMKWVVSKSSK